MARGPELGRFVVVGGPGRGKALLAVLVPIDRAAILKDQPRTRISRTTQMPSVSLAPNAGWPILISLLPALPHSYRPRSVRLPLSRHEATQVLSYLVKRLNSLADSTAQWRTAAWLGAYPCDHP